MPLTTPPSVLSSLACEAAQARPVISSDKIVRVVNARLEWARSATRHRISRERSRFVIEHCGLVLEQPAPDVSLTGDPRLACLGKDATGIRLEVMAVELDDGGLLVIHAMPMRERYRPDHEEVLKWRI